jgi:SAM-dependent methyltransferase
MATHVSSRETQFFYFDQLLARPVWKDCKILDFGGNVGGFLAGARNEVDHDDYWCLDVTERAIEIGRLHFPRAHFVFYNRYSSYFNPNGVRNLPVPDLGLKFDIILAFSVFTHTHQKEMLELVAQLRSMLMPRGVFAFTFFEPRRNTLVADRGMASAGKARPAQWCIEVGGKNYSEPDNQLCQQERCSQPGESYCSYFAADYMASLFPDGKVLPPVRPESQYCCTLRSTEYSLRAGPEASGRGH